MLILTLVRQGNFLPASCNKISGEVAGTRPTGREVAEARRGREQGVGKSLGIRWGKVYKRCGIGALTRLVAGEITHLVISVEKETRKENNILSQLPSYCQAPDLFIAKSFCTEIFSANGQHLVSIRQGSTSLKEEFGLSLFVAT